MDKRWGRDLRGDYQDTGDMKSEMSGLQLGKMEGVNREGRTGDK